jgi:hypothetical protein
MSAASSGPSLFPTLTGENETLYRPRRETFLYSMLGQAAVLALILYFCSCVIHNAPGIARRLPSLEEIPLIFSGHNGGGGGEHDLFPASHGNLPRASLDTQIVSPSVRLPTEMPKLPVEATVVVAPDIKIPQGGQIGDSGSKFSQWLSNGPGERGGIGPGCLRRRRALGWSWCRRRPIWNLSCRQNGNHRAPSDLQPGAQFF